MEMILKRLTKAQKVEILEAYRAGGNTNYLAEKYNCTTNTINRTVKNFLSDSEYKSLKAKRLRIGNKKAKMIEDETVKVENEKLSIESGDKLNNPELKKLSSLDLEDSYDLPSESKYNNNQEIDSNFELIEPLLSTFDFDQDKKKIDYEILDYETLPESVYMIVDKKVELDLQPIADLPEWSFLPENELKRNAILLFSNQRSAKRICLRNQRVIKIPNTSIFKLSKSYLISKGITRLILEDSIIALDN